MIGQVLAARLVLIGGCRGPADAARVADLRAVAERLGLGGVVEFAINAPFSEARALRPVPVTRLLGTCLSLLHARHALLRAGWRMLRLQQHLLSALRSPSLPQRACLCRNVK